MSFHTPRKEIQSDIEKAPVKPDKEEKSILAGLFSSNKKKKDKEENEKIKSLESQVLLFVNKIAELTKHNDEQMKKIVDQENTIKAKDNCIESMNININNNARETQIIKDQLHLALQKQIGQSDGQNKDNEKTIKELVSENQRLRNANEKHDNNRKFLIVFIFILILSISILLFKINFNKITAKPNKPQIATDIKEVDDMIQKMQDMPQEDI